MGKHQLSFMVSHHKGNTDLLASCQCGGFVRIYPLLDGETLDDVKALAKRDVAVEHTNYHLKEDTHV